MDRRDVCILINSTPRYYPIVLLQMLMMRRYAPKLNWKVFVATEVPDHRDIHTLRDKFNVEILELTKEESGFLESREAALRKLPSQYTYVLPLQDDFLMDREPMYDILAQACEILDMDRNVASLRLMPCPGPHPSNPLYHPSMKWRILTDSDTMMFTYQATLWRLYDIHLFYKDLLVNIAKDFPAAITPQQKKDIALKMNCAETQYGQEKLRKTPNVLHLAWERAGPWSNAVYLCPFPYRPTGIVQGRLEEFAAELSRREGNGVLKLDE